MMMGAISETLSFLTAIPLSIEYLRLNIENCYN